MGNLLSRPNSNHRLETTINKPSENIELSELLALTAFQGESSVSSLRAIICEPNQSHGTHRVCRRAQRAHSFKTALSKHNSAHVPEEFR